MNDATPAARLTAPVVEAIYTAMLGRGPDPAGLRHWSASDASPRDLIAAIEASDEYRSRTVTLAASYGSFEALTDRRAQRGDARLTAGGGATLVDDLPPGVAVFDLLDTLPWALIGEALPAPLSAWTVGPYSAGLARQLVDRNICERADAGVPAAGSAASIGVLTDPALLAAILWGRPFVFDTVADRLLVPIALDPTQLADQHAARLLAARIALHRLGFVEVVRAFRRRADGGPVRIDVSNTTPDPLRPHVVDVQPVEPLLSPRAHWLVASRRPTLDRP